MCSEFEVYEHARVRAELVWCLGCRNAVTLQSSEVHGCKRNKLCSITHWSTETWEEYDRKTFWNSEQKSYRFSWDDVIILIRNFDTQLISEHSPVMLLMYFFQQIFFMLLFAVCFLYYRGSKGNPRNFGACCQFKNSVSKVPVWSRANRSQKKWL